MSANDRQVAGNHYREIAEKAGAPQHWDLMWSLYGEAWFVGCITKYVLRYRKKNGVEDLKKAQHYLEKLIELETARLDAEKPQQIPAVPHASMVTPPAVERVISFDAGNGERKQIEFGDGMVCNCVESECPLGIAPTWAKCNYGEVRKHLQTKE